MGREVVGWVAIGRVLTAGAVSGCVVTNWMIVGCEVASAPALAEAIPNPIAVISQMAERAAGFSPRGASTVIQ